MRLGQVRVHGLHDLAQRVGARDSQHLWMHRRHHILPRRVFLCAEAAGHDHLAILGQRFANGVEAFLHRFIDEAASVDHNEIRAVIGSADGVAFGTQLGNDLLGIDQGLGTAK